MTAAGAFRDGVRRVNGAPIVLIGLFTTTLIVALPLSIVLRGMIDAHLGSSAVASTFAENANYDWWDEFSVQASGLGTTFTPSVIGFAAVLDNTSRLLDNEPLAATVAGATAAWLTIVSFLSGGIIDRYARRRPTRAHGFFAACGTHFWRFLRLGVVAALVYGWLFGAFHGWLFGAYESYTRNITVERTAFVGRAAAYAIFAFVLAVFTVIFDFARVRVVVEDRRSAIGALAASGRFVWRHAARVAGLCLLNAAALLLLMAVYAALSPGAPRSDMEVWLVLAVGQAYIFGRHYLKLLVYASETSLFQGVLAHAAYSAAPVLLWPDSPAVETMTNVEPTTAR
jgi:hypothetical protein